jgi:hypothetical protein
MIPRCRHDKLITFPARTADGLQSITRIPGTSIATSDQRAQAIAELALRGSAHGFVDRQRFRKIPKMKCMEAPV